MIRPAYRIASAARSRVESRKPPNGVLPRVARASAPSTASRSEPATRMMVPASSCPMATSAAAMATTTKPMTVTRLGVMPSRCASRTRGASIARPASFSRFPRSEPPRGSRPACGWLADIGHLGCAAAACHANPGGAADEACLQLVQLLERGGAEAADHLASLALRLDQVGEPQDAQVPADERLRKRDTSRQLVDRHRAEFGEQADDPQ